jgi:hypothetical protein
MGCPSCRRSLKHFQNFRWSRRTNRYRRHLIQNPPIHRNHRSMTRRCHRQNRNRRRLIHRNPMHLTHRPMTHRCHRLNRSRQTFRWNRLPILNCCCKT